MILLNHPFSLYISSHVVLLLVFLIFFRLIREEYMIKLFIEKDKRNVSQHRSTKALECNKGIPGEVDRSKRSKKLKHSVLTQILLQ